MQVSSRIWRTAVMVALLAGSVSAGARSPNVIVILADDLGWNDVGYHGSEINTPHLDHLAAGGIALQQFHSQPTCTPTRAALLTGKSPQRLGIYRQFAKNADKGLPVSETTLADHFKAAGYQTWLTGKWHLGHAERRYHPNARGFEHFYGHVTGGIGYWDHVHGGGLDWQRNGTTVREEGYSTHLLSREAVELIESRDTSRPFFLFASFNAPHLPNEAPAEAIEPYTHLTNPYRRLHAAMVSEFDAAVGDILATLQTQGVLENTLIWFMSDNGGLNRNAGLGGALTLADQLDRWFDGPVPVRILEFIRVNALEGGADNQPLRFGKGSVYEGGVRVPALVSWPGKLQPQQFNNMITVQDVLPTLLRAAGLKVPDDLDGTNMWEALTEGAQVTPPPYVTIGQSGKQAYYEWPWKLIESDEGHELYNLAQDPGESNNVAAQHPSQIAFLDQQLQALPRAENLHIPLYKVFWDPDFFGGQEDRPPWANLIPVDRASQPQQLEHHQ